MTKYAKDLVKQYDKNGDNMLQKDEQKDLRSPAADADLNHDGVITIDELVAHLSDHAKTSLTASSASGSGDSGSHHHDGDDRSKGDPDTGKRVLTGSAGGKDGDKRRSYRFISADERLPSGLPDWF
ncbi:MAG TPA: hypothetical protein VHU84_18765, partial [Lacipirellulaceae bacterium]|nr:hypothetical protein [Lacipirellulaceae bacterium]